MCCMKAHHFLLVQDKINTEMSRWENYKHTKMYSILDSIRIDNEQKCIHTPISCKFPKRTDPQTCIN